MGFNPPKPPAMLRPPPPQGSKVKILPPGTKLTSMQPRKANCDNCGAALPPSLECRYCGSVWHGGMVLDSAVNDAVVNCHVTVSPKINAKPRVIKS